MFQEPVLSISMGGKEKSCQDKLEQMQSSPVNCVFEEPRVRRFVCPYENCTYSTTRNSDLKVHIRTHTERNPISVLFLGVDMLPLQNQS